MSVDCPWNNLLNPLRGCILDVEVPVVTLGTVLSSKGDVIIGPSISISVSFNRVSESWSISFSMTMGSGGGGKYVCGRIDWW